MAPFYHPNDKEYCEKNVNVFAELTQFLEDQSLWVL